MLIILLSEVLEVFFFFAIATPDQVVYDQKGRGKVSSDQQIPQYVHAISLDQEDLSSAISNNYNNGQFHYAIS